MESGKTNIDNLLAKYVADEATDREKEFIENWANESEANKTLLQEMDLLMVKSLENAFDKNEAFKKINNSTKAQNSVSLYLKIAATILVLFVIGWSVLDQSDDIANNLIRIEASKKEAVNMPDGSIIILNAYSSLEYDSDYNENLRAVKLEGEAFFEVEKNEDKPFVIFVNGITVSVIGTSFNLKAISNKKIELVVETGVVELAKDSVQHILSGFGESIAIDLESNEAVRHKVQNRNHLFWKTGHLEFDEERLSEVVNSLSKIYDKDIMLSNEKLNNCLLTAKFDNLDHDQVLEVIANTYGFELKEENGKLILYGESC